MNSDKRREGIKRNEQLKFSVNSKIRLESDSDISLVFTAKCILRFSPLFMSHLHLFLRVREMNRTVFLCAKEGIDPQLSCVES